ncbi:3-deoxy-D-manno-octulosonic acid transferase [Thermosulfurimonas marina]|uniref:3-deoxy-D-manno-octulosonic acid transferase n=1 Tax=Thermosulfurimonas marina TaxID=2047767 RepID=A0A6H1WTY1_9BACT|nr:glycosyltransferase N-terminal domain-containing protein [Thermosulfurimonas marina]QJA06631.1 3-deoxy-D-manno-octulosonic acid transferase [Thermosulfurimonas marina]
MYRAYRLASFLAERLLRPFFPGRFRPPEAGPVDLWMHAASVGELRVAEALLAALASRGASPRVALTLQTESARRLAQRRNLPAQVFSAPWDGPRTVVRTLEILRPRVLVLLETELWPNLLAEALRREIPVCVVNGRLSDRSFPRYLALRRLFRPLLERLTFVGAISPLDRERFLALGAPPERVEVVGNAKYDLLVAEKERVDLEGLSARLRLREGEKVVVFGSMRGGEESLVREVVRQLAAREEVRFVVAPRHLERVSSFKKALEDLGLSLEFFSRHRPARIVLVDEIGPLFGLYGLATAAVVGGSFVPKGGQNPVEPAVWGVPTLFGPHMENFREEVRRLSGAGVRMVQTSAEALSLLRQWLDEEGTRREAREALQKSLSALLGASERYAARILRILNGSHPS